jgi:hypothetical protein
MINEMSLSIIYYIYVYNLAKTFSIGNIARIILKPNILDAFVIATDN